MKHLNSINPQIVYNIFLHKTDVEAFAIEEKKSGLVKEIDPFLIWNRIFTKCEEFS